MVDNNIGGWIKHSDAIADDTNLLTQEKLNNVYQIDDSRVGLELKDIKGISAYNLEQYISKILEDQGNLGLCFAFAMEGIQEFYNKNTPPLGNTDDLSEMFIGYWSRYICGGGPPVGDYGSTILATMQAAQKYGVCLENLWPYIESKENTKPSSTANNNAKLYKISKYFAIQNDSNKIDNIKKSIYAAVPIMFGCEVHSSIMNVGSDGIEPYAKSSSVSDPAVGGHARYIYGWDDNRTIPNAPIKGAFLVRNSWGPDWGANGDSWVSYQVWKDQETDDMGITSAIFPNVAPVPIDPCQKLKDAITAAIKALQSV